MKPAISFLTFNIALALSNVVGAGVLLVLQDIIRAEEVWSFIAIGIVAVACAIVFLDGVVHLGGKYVNRNR